MSHVPPPSACRATDPRTIPTRFPTLVQKITAIALASFAIFASFLIVPFPFNVLVSLGIVVLTYLYLNPSDSHTTTYYATNDSVYYVNPRPSVFVVDNSSPPVFIRDGSTSSWPPISRRDVAAPPSQQGTVPVGTGEETGRYCYPSTQSRQQGTVPVAARAFDWGSLDRAVSGIANCFQSTSTTFRPSSVGTVPVGNRR
jgi:hypothetical protein